jgi:hypothetical protein
MNLGYTIPNAKKYITEGRKIHTFRFDPGNRWQPGKTIHHATGIRTKHYECFLVNECIWVQKAKVEYYGGRLLMWINGRKLSQRQVAEFVYNDGLESVDEFIKFIFYDKKGKRKTTIIEGEKMLLERVTGNIIHWTKKIYY